MAGTDGKPGRDCPRCSRLVAFRKTWRAKEPTWFNAPVPSFGRLDARLLIVGLAPGLQGANRTGRPFTATDPRSIHAWTRVRVAESRSVR